MIRTFLCASALIGIAALASAQPSSPETTASQATSEDRTGVVQLHWRIDSAQNNYGFYLNRSETPNGPWVRVNEEVIPGVGTTADPAEFDYTDTGLVRGHDYYYQLIELSTDGTEVDMTEGQPLVAHCRTVEEDVIHARQTLLGEHMSALEDEQITSPLISGEFAAFFFPRTAEEVQFLASWRDWEDNPGELNLLPQTQLLVIEEPLADLPAEGEYHFAVGEEASVEFQTDPFNVHERDSTERGHTVSVFTRGN